MLRLREVSLLRCTVELQKSYHKSVHRDPWSNGPWVDKHTNTTCTHKTPANVHNVWQPDSPSTLWFTFNKSHAKFYSCLQQMLWNIWWNMPLHNNNCSGDSNKYRFTNRRTSFGKGVNIPYNRHGHPHLSPIIRLQMGKHDTFSIKEQFGCPWGPKHKLCQTDNGSLCSKKFHQTWTFSLHIS